jgi:hypothetical protein
MASRRQVKSRCAVGKPIFNLQSVSQGFQRPHADQINKARCAVNLAKLTGWQN